MEDPNEEEWRIQEFRPADKNTGRLRRIWNSGLNIGKKIALTGIVVSAAPLALPPLVVLSAFGVAFTVPFGFYFASYAATDKIMSTLLSNPKQPLPPLLLQYEDVFSNDEEERAYEYNDDKVEGDGYEEENDLEEEEKEWEDDTNQAINVRIELDDKENNEIQDDSEFVVDIGIDEDVQDIGDAIVDKFEQDGYEEDAAEYMEVEEPVPSMVSEISSMEEGKGEMLGNGVEMDVVSVEVGEENDIDQVEVEDVFGPQMSMEDSKCMVKFGDVELEELERETSGMIDSIRDEGVGETKKNLEFSVEKEEPIPSIASEILRGIREAEQDISLVKEEGKRELLGNALEAVVVSAEAGGENDIDVEQIEQVDVFGPRVISMEDSWPKVKFGDKPEEMERETAGMIESIRDEGTRETKKHEQSMDKVSPDESIRDVDGIQQVFVPYVTLQKNGSESVEGIFDDVEPVESKIANDKAVSSKEEIQDTRHNIVMLVVPEELEPVRDITRNDKDLQGIRSAKQMEGIGLNLKGEEGEIIAVDKDPVHLRKLVVHFNKSGDNIRKATDSNTRGETLIIMRADTRETATESEFNKVQDCCHSQSANNHSRGIYLNSGDIQDANLQDQELPSTSTSKPIEKLKNEISIWKQINAMRTIVGYEAPPHVSCVEELKALYVFTGVEPPPSFTEPSSIVDVNEKLLFLMAVVGVKE